MEKGRAKVEGKGQGREGRKGWSKEGRTPPTLKSENSARLLFCG